jgi:Rrf2 family protein
MRLSTRSRYGTRMMQDLAEHYDKGPTRLGEIAKRQDISVKYLEQLIIPLKHSNFIRSIRGPKGGHMLTRPPEEISVGQIVAALEGGTELTGCIGNPSECGRSGSCLTRCIWKEVSKAIYDKLHSINLSTILEMENSV